MGRLELKSIVLSICAIDVKKNFHFIIKYEYMSGVVMSQTSQCTYVWLNMNESAQ